MLQLESELSNARLQTLGQAQRQVIVTLTSSAKHLSDWLQVGVHTYMRLLATGGAGNSSLFTKELVADKRAVVRTLVHPRGDDQADTVRAVLGLELLAHFIAVQNTSDFAQPIASLVKLACALPLPMPRWLSSRCDAHDEYVHVQLTSSCTTRLPYSGP